MQEELARPARVVVVEIAEVVGIDVGVIEPEFAPFRLAEGVGDLGFAVADGLDLGAQELDPGLEFLVDEILVQRPGIADLGEAPGIWFLGRHGG